MVWIPKNHPLAEKEAIDPQDLDGVPFVHILPHEDTDVDAFLRRHHVHPDFRLSTVSNYTAWCMVEGGLGLSINNELMSEGWQGSVTVRPFTTGDTITLGLAVPSLSAASPALKKWVEVTKEWMGKQGNSEIVG